MASAVVTIGVAPPEAKSRATCRRSARLAGGGVRCPCGSSGCLGPCPDNGRANSSRDVSKLIRGARRLQQGCSGGWQSWRSQVASMHGVGLAQNPCGLAPGIKMLGFRARHRVVKLHGEAPREPVGIGGGQSLRPRVTRRVLLLLLLALLFTRHSTPATPHVSLVLHATWAWSSACHSTRRMSITHESISQGATHTSSAWLPRSSQSTVPPLCSYLEWLPQCGLVASKRRARGIRWREHRRKGYARGSCDCAHLLVTCPCHRALSCVQVGPSRPD